MFKRLRDKIVIRKVADWLGPVPDAIAKRINVNELGKAIMAGISAGGGIAGVLASLKASVGLWLILDPTSTGFIVGIVAGLLELARRYLQGSKGEK